MHCSIEGATNDKNFNNDNIYVYTLAPEISSVVAKESLASAALTDLAAQLTGIVSGANAQVSARLQRALQESMLTLMEYPVQFALYGEKANEFSFAFGPRRKLSKRNWFYRNILFMDPYKVEYFIGPGTRDCYALVVMPEGVLTLQIKVWVADNFGTFKPKPAFVSEKDKKPSLDKMISDTEFVYRTLNNHQDKKQPNQCTDKNQPENQQYQPTYIYELDTALKNAKDQPIASENPQAVPGYLYPKLSNTLLVISGNVVSPEMTVFVGPVAIPKEKIKILGRSRLLVTVEPDERLKNMLWNKTAEPIGVTLVSPDRAIEKPETFKIELRDSIESPQKARAFFQPDTVRPGERVKLIRNDKSLNFEKIKAVVISSMPPITEFHEKKKPEEVEFSAPSKDIPAPGVPLTVDIIFEEGFSPHKISLSEAIKYK
jgi:hypothetical protein